MIKPIVASSLLALAALPAPSLAANKCPGVSVCMEFDWEGTHSLSNGQMKQVMKLCTGKKILDPVDDGAIRGRRLQWGTCTACGCPGGCNDPTCPPACGGARRRELELELGFLPEEDEEGAMRELEELEEERKLLGVPQCVEESINAFSDADQQISNLTFQFC